MVVPVGPPHKCFVVDALALRVNTRSVAEYPKVIATTRNAPGSTGGLGTGRSKYRQPAPTKRATIAPSRIFILGRGNFPMRDEGEQVFIHPVLQRRRHAVRSAGVDLKRGTFDDF